MAVGFDSALPKTSAPVLRAKPQAPMQAATPQYAMRPPAIADSAVQAAVNNQRAAGYGARESALSAGDRGGISRGKGQQYAAQMAQEAADAKASASAVQTEMAAADTNARARQAAESMQANERLANAGLLEGLRNTQAMERLQRRGWQQDLYEAIRRGRFGLDQQQLDYTPLLNGLFE
jgi:hypothetical protein